MRKSSRTKLEKLLVAIVVLVATIAGTTALAQSNYEPYAITTFAGTPGLNGVSDGPSPLQPIFNDPAGGAVDGAGNIYVADSKNHLIRKISPNGTVSNLAGLEGVIGSADGTGSAARFNYPTGLTMDGAGNIYVADNENHTIRKIASDGTVTTFAGLAGIEGDADGTGSAARFRYPSAVGADGAGNVYVGDGTNYTIRKITPGGLVSTLAGYPGSSGWADGTGSDARFNYPHGVAPDNAGNVYVADTHNYTIRKITPAGVVTTFAGLAGQRGSNDGIGSAARFFYPNGIEIDSAGNAYVAEWGNCTIRKITPGGEVSTIAGVPSVMGNVDGAANVAQFLFPEDVTLDTSGNIYVVDSGNFLIRKITPAGVVSRLAGNPGFFTYVNGLAVDGAGNVYCADQGNQMIRKITPSGTVSTLAGLPRTEGSADGVGSAARFKNPWAVAVNNTGDVYVADTSNNTIRKITANGSVSTFAGVAGTFGHVDGTGSAARFYTPRGVAVDASGNIYVADSNSCTIRKITPGGMVTTIAGLHGSFGSSDGSGTAARFNSPGGIAVDSSGNVYVADTGNATIRKITSGGVVSTFAGLAGAGGDADGTGSAARFQYPAHVAVDSADNLYVSDSVNVTIRKITPDRVVTTLAGLTLTSGNVDGVASVARFDYPTGIAVDGAGKLYVADFYNYTIRAGFPVPAFAVSRKVHGSAGRFDINLPLTGEPGVECRGGDASGSHAIVVSFSKVIATGDAAVTNGGGQVAGDPLFNSHSMTINLTNVSDDQQITLSLSKLTDSFGQTLPDIAVKMNVLLGDTTGNRVVNSSDISQTKLQSGSQLSSANFRTDINVSGSVSATDVAMVKANAGHGLPQSNSFSRQPAAEKAAATTPRRAND